LIKEEKIILSKVSQKDTDFLYELINERKIINEVYIPSDIPTLNQHKKFIKNFLKNNEQNNYEAWYIISVFNKNNELTNVGSIPLKKDGEWGYQILKKYHNKGIGQIAAKKLFKMHPKKQFWARCNANNKRAQYLLEKLGFKVTILTYKKIN